MTWYSVCLLYTQRTAPSAATSTSSSCAELTFWSPHSGTAVVACSSIETQVLGKTGGKFQRYP